MLVKVDENKICLKNQSRYALIYPIWKFLRSLHNFPKFVTKYLFDKCRLWCCISNFIFRVIVKFKCICEKKNLINYFNFHFNLSALLCPLPFFHPSKNQLQFLQVYHQISLIIVIWRVMRVKNMYFESPCWPWVQGHSGQPHGINPKICW